LEALKWIVLCDFAFLAALREKFASVSPKGTKGAAGKVSTRSSLC
jgi:hypothetical protein